MSLVLLGLFLLAMLLWLLNGMHLVVVKQQYWYLVVLLAVYLCCYTTLQSFAFQQTGSITLVRGLQYMKELMIFLTVAAFVFMQKDIFSRKWSLRSIDVLILVFVGMALMFVVLPLGSASVLDKLIYFKNILMPFVMYWLGRNIILQETNRRSVVHTILLVAVAAFLLGLLEHLILQRHFHSIIGYGLFNDKVNEIDPSGNYGLSWTFEAQGGRPRYAAFFANPLELASACLLAFPAAFIAFKKSDHRTNAVVYAVCLLMVLGSMYFAFSRASMAALFGQVVFIAFLFRYYKLIATGIFSFILIVVYIAYFASEDLRYFVMDTITFENPSSFGHLVEWLQGIESMIVSPLGIGLAMSGNASMVDDAIKVGGENQFIIYGVQMGVPALTLYLVILFSAIRISMKAYRSAPTRELQRIPFIAATTKFGLLLPLFTANAELYLYVSYLSWWLVGQSVLIRSSALAKE